MVEVGTELETIRLGIFQFFMDLVGFGDLTEISDYFVNLDPTGRNVMSLIGILVCIVGLLQCFLGFKLFRAWCGFVGFTLGTLFAIALSTSGILSNAHPLAADIICLLLIVILGITGAAIAYRVYLIGLFIYAFNALFLIGFILAALITNSLLAGLVTGIITGTAMGVLAVIYRRFWIILLTSISGGISVCTGLMMIMQNTNLGYAFILPPVLAVAGFFVQYFADKNDTKKPAKTAEVKAETANTADSQQPVQTASAEEPAQAPAAETPDQTPAADVPEQASATEDPAAEDPPAEVPPQGDTAEM